MYFLHLPNRLWWTHSHAFSPAPTPDPCWTLQTAYKPWLHETSPQSESSLHGLAKMVAVIYQFSSILFPIPVSSHNYVEKIQTFISSETPTFHFSVFQLFRIHEDLPLTLCVSKQDFLVIFLIQFLNYTWFKSEVIR